MSGPKDGAGSRVDPLLRFIRQFIKELPGFPYPFHHHFIEYIRGRLEAGTMDAKSLSSKMTLDFNRIEKAIGKVFPAKERVILSCVVVLFRDLPPRQPKGGAQAERELVKDLATQAAALAQTLRRFAEQRHRGVPTLAAGWLEGVMGLLESGPLKESDLDSLYRRIDSAMNALKDAALPDRLADLAWIAELYGDVERPRGRPRTEDPMRFLVRELYPVYRAIGGVGTAYRDNYDDCWKGGLLDLVEEILVQVHYSYRSRGALADLIVEERLLVT